MSKVIRAGYEVDARRIRVSLVNGLEVTGIVNIADNNCRRVSELFTKEPEGYLVMCKCDNGQKVMFINKKHIIWAVPLD